MAVYKTQQTEFGQLATEYERRFGHPVKLGLRSQSEQADLLQRLRVALETGKPDAFFKKAQELNKSNIIVD